MEEKKVPKGNSHTVYIEDRTTLVVTDVTDVSNFNEDTILLTLSKGGLIIKGQNLHMQRLDLEEGKAIISGNIQSAVYTEKKEKQEKNLLGRLLK